MASISKVYFSAPARAHGMEMTVGDTWIPPESLRVKTILRDSRGCKRSAEMTHFTATLLLLLCSRKKNPPATDFE